MEHLSNIIAAAASDNTVDMRTAVDAVMRDKVAAVLDQVRQEQGNVIFDNVGSSEEHNEVD